MTKPIFPVGAILRHVSGGDTRWKVLDFNPSTDSYKLIELPINDNFPFTYLRTSTESALRLNSNIRRP